MAERYFKLIQYLAINWKFILIVINFLAAIAQTQIQDK